MRDPSGAIATREEYRKLPAVATLLQEPAISSLAHYYGEAQVTDALRAVLDTARQQIAQGGTAPPPAAWPTLVETALLQTNRPTLRPVINATGVIIHTNLGRAPLSHAALAAVKETGYGYSNLEYDLDAGSRGSRYEHSRVILRTLTGAEDAVVVNNNAAAIFLALSTLCQGRPVLISRGQLVEIGGGFRIPDVLRQSGAQLVEVGTTNRTHLRDYADAITAETAAIMRVHSSNFKQIGFVTMPGLAELAELVRSHNADRAGQPLLLIDDLGSGSLLDTSVYGLAPEPLVQESLAAGADIVTFSGDKLLGGPQAGLILGRKAVVEPIRRHPLARALRVDKMTLAALDATLRSYLRGRATKEIPVWQMISTPLATLRERVLDWQQRIAARGITSQIQEGESAVGGGSLPGETLPTVTLAVAHPQPVAVAARLRRASTPVICRIQRDTLHFDPRTVLPEQDELLVTIIGSVLPADEHLCNP
ncbi:MAG: L-seryl-tRNA(Sec) selenium transferase [Chloroflexi bacterium]|nr:MAG: L-seryl-tRNA(Sec) selenium transferase [Chloroflexota bacterium]